jgi:hypothetical protein
LLYCFTGLNIFCIFFFCKKYFLYFFF